MDFEKNREQNISVLATKKENLEEKCKQLNAEIRRLERHEVFFSFI